MTTGPDTGHRIGAATDTAAFVRAQMAKGVSVETLRRRLGIRPEHMLELLAWAPEPALPKVELAQKPKPAPTGGWGAVRTAVPKKARIDKPPTIAGLSKVEVIRRAQENRAQAYRMIQMIVPAVAESTGFDRKRIEGRDKTEPALQVRGMVFSLLHEMAPTMPFNAMGWAFDQRSAGAVERAIERCHRTRQASVEFNAWYLRALSRLAP